MYTFDKLNAHTTHINILNNKLVPNQNFMKMFYVYLAKPHQLEYII